MAIGMWGHQSIRAWGRAGGTHVNKIASKLDWNRMLGFEQVAANRLAVQEESAKLGAKVGAKIGDKGGSPV